MSASRPNALEIDLAAVTENVRCIRRLVGPETTLFAAVKANGYGYGLPQVAEAMLGGGADAFSLADPADAAKLRDAGIDVPVLLYGGVLPEPETARFLAERDLTCTIADLDAARAWAATATPVKAYLKVEIGLERLGVPAERAAGFAAAVCSLPGISVAGIYTHVHGSESTDYVAWQLDRFEQVLDALEREAIDIPVRLADSSVTVGLERRPRLNAVDPGHLLYGLLPAGRPTPLPGLRPVFVSLTTRVIQVKQVDRPDFVAEAPIPIREHMRIAVIPLGRSDGLRTLTTGEVLIRGRRAPIVGRLSLEHARIDVTDIPRCEAGDEVVVIGRQGDDEIAFSEVAALHGLDGVGLMLEARASIPRRHRGQVSPVAPAAATMKR